MRAVAAEVVPVQVGDVEGLLQLRHGGDESRFVDAMKLDGQLVDSPQLIVGESKKALPLRPFDVHFDDQLLARVAVLPHLVLERVEGAPVFGALAGADALFVKHRLAARASRAGEVEAIVLVDVDAKPGRHVAAPLVVAGDAVRVGRLHIAEQVAAEQIAAIMRFAEALERAVGQRHRLDLCKQPLPVLDLARENLRASLGDRAARLRVTAMPAAASPARHTRPIATQAPRRPLNVPRRASSSATSMLDGMISEDLPRADTDKQKKGEGKQACDSRADDPECVPFPAGPRQPLCHGPEEHAERGDLDRHFQHA